MLPFLCLNKARFYRFFTVDSLTFYMHYHFTFIANWIPWKCKQKWANSVKDWRYCECDRTWWPCKIHNNLLSHNTFSLVGEIRDFLTASPQSLGQPNYLILLIVNSYCMCSCCGLYCVLVTVMYDTLVILRPVIDSVRWKRAFYWPFGNWSGGQRNKWLEQRVLVTWY